MIEFLGIFRLRISLCKSDGKYKSVYGDSTIICCHDMTYAEWLTVDSQIANFVKISTEFVFIDGARWL